MAIRTKTLTQTGVGESLSFDIKDSNTIAIAWLVATTGTVTYSLRHSLDDINFIDNGDATALTADADGNYILPIRSVRVKVTAGTGSATLVVRQLVV
ncbi:MAG: hypothetical protein V3S69_05345 [Dehalococcoidales bacterium]